MLLGAAARLPIRVNNVVVGGGISAGVILGGLARSPDPGKVLAITRGDRWPTAFPRHHLLGQSRQGLSIFPKTDFHHPKGRMSVDEHVREVISYQIQAIEPFRGEDIDCLDTDLARIVKQGNGELLLQCVDGSQVVTNRVFLATGVGPERTLAHTGVIFENEAGPRRQVFHEVSTALQSMQENPEYWRNKSVTVYGAGATAAWVVEVAMGYSLRDIQWLAPRGFQTANPGNRNSEILELTKDHQHVASILRLKYEGGLDGAPGENGLLVTTDHGGTTKSYNTDIVICAAGSNPMAPTGIESILGPMYHELIPMVGRQQGVFATVSDGSIVVTSTALSHNPQIQSLIQGQTFPTLNPENHVIAGLAVSKLSAEAAVESAVATASSGGGSAGQTLIE